MTYIGELISIGVAFSWTATALLSEFGSKRLGNLTLNVLRMALALVFSLVMFMVIFILSSDAYTVVIQNNTDKNRNDRIKNFQP